MTKEQFDTWLTQDYSFVQEFTSSFTVQIAVIWAIERAYNEAWSQASVQPTYQEFADRWGSPEFTAYCQALLHTVDDCMSKANQLVGTAVGKVAQQEVAFWNMAYEAETG
eukprot:jgi/Astpho2/4055/Aster-01210